MEWLSNGWKGEGEVGASSLWYIILLPKSIYFPGVGAPTTSTWDFHMGDIQTYKYKITFPHI